MPFRFEVVASSGRARVGRLTTAHGVVDTPAFMPVGTHGAVKGLTPEQLAASGASIMLANLFHLECRPGIETIERLGGLHAFTGWSGPILTDSGGFQVFSLQGLRRLDGEGVTFRSPVDGRLMRLTPERAARLQHRLGVDIAMMLDECPPAGVGRATVEAALERTQRWAEAGRREWPGTRGGFFGIVQGGIFADLRRRAVEELTALDFDGYAIGGVSVGEPTEERRRVVEQTVSELPADRPRYLMGVGTPPDLLHAVACGVDLFDCVLPTRNARHGTLFTRNGLVRIRNARFREDERPIDSACDCPVCRRQSRAFLHHLMRCDELTARVLATLHNLRYYLDFMQDVREAIASGTLEALGTSVTAAYGEDRG